MNKKHILLLSAVGLSCAALTGSLFLASNLNHFISVDAAAKTYSITLKLTSDKYSGGTAKTSLGNTISYTYGASKDQIYNTTPFKRIQTVKVTLSRGSQATVYFGSSSKPDQSNRLWSTDVNSGGTADYKSGYARYFRVCTADLMEDIDISQVVVTYTC